MQAVFSVDVQDALGRQQAVETVDAVSRLLGIPGARSDELQDLVNQALRAGPIPDGDATPTGGIRLRVEGWVVEAPPELWVTIEDDTKSCSWPILDPGTFSIEEESSQVSHRLMIHTQLSKLDLSVDEIIDHIPIVIPEDAEAILRGQRRSLLHALTALHREQQEGHTRSLMLQMLLLRSQVCLWEWVGDARIDVFNRTTYTAFDMAVLKGQIHPEDAHKVTDARETLKSGTASADVLYRLLVNGEYRWVSEHLQRIASRSRAERFRIFATTVDVNNSTTARVEAERLAELRERMLGVVGHDLRGPLSAIRMGIRTLETLVDETDGRELLHHMDSSVERAATLLSDLLDYVRGRAGGTMPIYPQRVRLQDVVQAQVDEVRLAFPKIQFEVRSAGEGDAVHCDPDRAGQAIGNLLRNAAVHGSGEVSVRIDGQTVVVENPGEPIPEDRLPHIFDAFEQEDDSGTVGLGLWIAREIAQVHGGRISVQSTSERTAFSFHLPSRPAEQSS